MKTDAYRCLRRSAAALAIVLSSGCSVLYDTSDVGAGIDTGATKVHVTAALGAPARIVTQRTREAWLYCRESELLDRYVVAVFEGSNLQSLEQHLEFEFGACRRFFEDFTLSSAGG